MGRGYWAGAMEAVEYPKHVAELQRLHSQKITANLNGMPGGGGESRTTENIALKELSPSKQKDYETHTHEVLAGQTLYPGSYCYAPQYL